MVGMGGGVQGFMGSRQASLVFYSQTLLVLAEMIKISSIYQVLFQLDVQTSFQINLLNPAFGKTTGDRDKSVGEMINELQIMRQEMRHPNIVRYHKTFKEG